MMDDPNRNDTPPMLPMPTVLRHIVDYIKMYNNDGVGSVKVNLIASPSLKMDGNYVFQLRLTLSPPTEPPTEADPERPPDLGVNVTDVIDLSEKIG